MIANHLIQSTVFVALAALLTLLLRNNRAGARYWIWLAASLKFLVPFSLFVEIGHRLTWTTVPVITQPQLSFVMEEVVAPVYIATTPAPITSVSTPSILPAIWIFGTVAVLMFWMLRWHRVARALRKTNPITEGRAYDRLRRLDSTTKLASFCNSIEPGVFGILRPVLYLPEGITEHLDDAQLDAILAHELTHIRRRDNLTALLHMLVEAIFWFHPLVWWIGAKLIEERERACDEEVVRLGSDPEVYAESILKICRHYLGSPLVCVSGVTGSNLRQRIEAIMASRVIFRLNFAKKSVLAIAAAVALALPLIIGIANVPAIRAQAKGTRPRFEVASIRRCNPVAPSAGGARGSSAGSRSDSGMFRTACVPLRNLIRMAYIRFADGTPLPEGSQLRDQPLQGGPDWLNDDHYVVEARPTDPSTVGMMSGPMLASLLEERFSLRVHRTNKEVQVLAMVVAKNGARLQKTRDGDCTPVNSQEPPPTVVPGGLLPCGYVGGDKDGVRLVGTTVAALCPILRTQLHREVIDKTGLTGLFNYHWDLVFGPPNAPLADDGSGADPTTTVSEALQKLGLKLEPAKGVAEFLVIDHVERPTEN